MTDAAPSQEQEHRPFWEQFPWRKWVLAAGVLIGAGLTAGAWVVPTSIQVRIVQFMIPPYSYVCLGLAVIALTELPEPVTQRIVIATALLGMTVLHVFGYAAAGIPPLLILGVQIAFLMIWIARRQRLLWSLLWMLETLVWIGIAWGQGRLP
ncbi:MAG: hypothetical protein ACUVT1_03950 [Anaerolineae bacterium]